MEELSPFTSKIGTNYAATREEAERITTFLSGPVSKLQQLQAEIVRAKARYDELVEQHLALSREIEAHQALMSPIRRVPTDILQEIFLHCLPTKHNAVISTTECPILLTRICSGWRHIALNTAMLWASIHVPIPVCSLPERDGRPSTSSSPIHNASEFEVTMEIARRQAIAIREWLGRSGECLLSISIYDDDYRTPEEAYTVILDALIFFRNRWGALKCETPAWGVMRVAAIPASELPRLHTLTFHGNSAYGARDPEGEIGHPGVGRWADSGVIRAPCLHSITYKNMSERFIGFPVRRAQLTSITWNGIGWNLTEIMPIADLANFLAECPLLRLCHLDIPVMLQSSHKDKSEALLPRSILLSHLTHFTIKAGAANLGALFDALDAPALEELEVLVDIIPAASLHALLRRAADTLRTLTLHPQVVARDDFFTCLEICPNLTELTLRGGYTRLQHMQAPNPHAQLDDVFLHDLLTATSEVGVVNLPRLTRFECYALGTFSDAGVLNVLLSRSAATAGGAGSVAVLSYALISFGRPQELPIAHTLKELAEVGVKFVPLHTALHPARKRAAADGIADLSAAPPCSEPIF